MDIQPYTACRQYQDTIRTARKEKTFSSNAKTEDSKGWLFWIPGKRIIARLESAKFDEKLFYRPGTGQIQLIQVNNLFNKSMVNELINQDKLITEISSATYQEAIQLVNRNQWITAINDELESIIEENIFETIELKQALAEVPHESILSTKWAFVKKPERYKAGLVAWGFKQIHEINYD
ncbi:hypothetical protein O181_111601 [Austropuccinia psidii MF-1]|uniref:Reverse transcriptase Ty1/copia-type domain-containing protein n=1 Tax=Austropuccinia psidii MF-1 TaxID=1389203 RepID=A0A9Q3K1D9_9BASI|nr:hypothetical protein [Austropuccinia psidii MF-1]